MYYYLLSREERDREVGRETMKREWREPTGEREYDGYRSIIKWKHLHQWAWPECLMACSQMVEV